MSNQKRDLTTGSIAGHFIKLGFPMFIGLCASMTYAIADSFWIGRIAQPLGALQQAALSNMYMLDIFLVKFALGLGIGIIALTSPLFGKKDMQQARHMVSAAVILTALLGVFLMIMGFLGWQQLFGFLAFDSDLVPYAKSYLWFWLPSVVFILSSMLLSSAMRAAGNAKIPGMIMLFSSLLNIIFDPFLIFGIGFFPELQIAGAAIVSTSTRFLSVCIMIYAAWRMELLSFTKLDHIIAAWKRYINVALPIIVTQILPPLALFILMKFVNHYGAMAAAGYGPAIRIEAFALIPVMIIAAMLGPIIGQNIGAKNISRIRESLVFSIKWSCLWGVIVSFAFILFRSQMGYLFNNDPAALDAFSGYLFVSAISVYLIGINGVLTQFLNVASRQAAATIITFIYLFVIAIPLGFLAIRQGLELQYLYWIVVIANVMGFILLSIFSYGRFKELRQECEDSR